MIDRLRMSKLRYYIIDMQFLSSYGGIFEYTTGLI